MIIMKWGKDHITKKYNSMKSLANNKMTNKWATDRFYKYDNNIITYLDRYLTLKDILYTNDTQSKPSNDVKINKLANI